MGGVAGIGCTDGTTGTTGGPRNGGGGGIILGPGGGVNELISESRTFSDSASFAVSGRTSLR
jgi:hypothetical protein